MPPIAPTIMPSITNGQRMNQLVAPTSFITSTSRRRAKIDSRIVFATSAIDASTSSAASIAVSAFTKPVALRILSVSSSRSRTSSIAASFCASRCVDDRADLVRVVGVDAERVGQRVAARAARTPRGCACAPSRAPPPWR